MKGQLVRISYRFKKKVRKGKTFTIQQLKESVDKFLNFNKFKILDGKGNISHQMAIEKAGKEYEQFNKTQKDISDFDKHIKKK